MKLIQAVKIITEAGLSPEMCYRAAKDDTCGEEILALFGVRRWARDTGYSSIEERDIVVCVIVEGASIKRVGDSQLKDDIALGMAKSLAEEATAKAAAGKAA